MPPLTSLAFFPFTSFSFAHTMLYLQKVIYMKFPFSFEGFIKYITDRIEDVILDRTTPFYMISGGLFIYLFFVMTLGILLVSISSKANFS